MKKNVVLLALAFSFATFTVKAQDDAAFTIGTKVVTASYGIGNIYKTLFKLSNSVSGGDPSLTSKFKSTGPFGLGFEYGVAEHIGIGLQLGYNDMTNTQTYKDGIDAGKDYIITQKLTQMNALARANYHFGESAQFDPYIGIGLGYGNFKYSAKDNDPENTDPLPTISIPGAFSFSGQLGARYYFTPAIGAYVEIGYLAGSICQAGVAIKF
jgi:outer membrane protein W